MAPWFAVNMPDIDFQDIYYYLKPTGAAGRRVGRPARADEGHLREARHPRGRAQVPRRRHRASTSPRSSTTATGRTSRSRGSCSATWTPRCASTPTWSSSTSARSSRPATTSSRRSTPRCGAAAAFIYVPPGVECEMPLQAYFRINSENAGQFERTLIIADEGSQVHYIEGCSAPVYTSDSLHSAVVEIVVKPSRPGSPTPPSRTGARTSTTSSPSGPGSRPRATWSGSTATSAVASSR